MLSEPPAAAAAADSLWAGDVRRVLPPCAPAALPARPGTAWRAACSGRRATTTAPSWPPDNRRASASAPSGRAGACCRTQADAPAASGDPPPALRAGTPRGRSSYRCRSAWPRYSPTRHPPG
ncbi:hypothetical protein G6F22_021251 [Rhizopus arrhizus]|nr:hypothetical protein G6F22_021251 [Rhizopus arrhizus]